VIIRTFLILSLLVGFSAHAAMEAQNLFQSPLKYDSNVAPEVKTQMEEDLLFVESVKGATVTPLFKEIYGDMNGRPLAEWIYSRVKSVGYEERDDGAVAYVIMFMPTKMWLTQNFVLFKHPQISRLMIVFHEARHTEIKNGNWSHATCPTPFKNEKGEDMKSIWTGRLLAGEPACDITPKGSYGSSTILLKNVAMNCETCSEKVKMDAEIYATDQLGRITNAAAKAAMLKDFGVQ
jgi:hypothetical protein